MSKRVKSSDGRRQVHIVEPPREVHKKSSARRARRAEARAAAKRSREGGVTPAGATPHPRATEKGNT